MKLRRITIKGEYNLKNVDLDLKNNCALLVGANGCGKTNIIKCVATVLKATTEYKMVVELRSGDMRLKEAKEPSMKLYFDLNKNERKKFMELRMTYVIEKTVKVCKPLVELEEGPSQSYNGYLSSPKVTTFRQKVIPQLLDVFQASCQRLGEWPEDRSSDEADVTISYYNYRGQVTTLLNLLKTDLLEDNTEENKIISTCMKEVFGDEVWGKTFSFEERNSTEQKLSQMIGDILKNITFLERTTYTESNSERSFLKGPAGSMDLEELRTFSDRYSASQYLNDVIKGFIVSGSAYILPQHRGRVKDEEGNYFWTMEKAEKKIITAYLSKEGSKECAHLLKVKEALVSIGGLELDVANGNDMKPSVFLREFEKKHAEWREISQYSGGQQELVMVLSAIHLSEADNVLLDEPGHSLHPPKQAQLRRWFEEKREPEQVLFAITHSSDMISPKWLESLYHMYPDGDDYSASCLRRSREEFRKTARCFSPSFTDQSNKFRNKDNDDNAVTVGSKRPFALSDAHQGSPSKKKRVLHSEIELDCVLVDFLMKGEMRRLFFSSGVVFVEGDSDRSVIQALRTVGLHMATKVKENPDSTVREWYDAHRETQMDRWDIIPIGGCKNWLKAYKTANDLKIPFVVVLDADVLNQNYGGKISAITIDGWRQSTLATMIAKEKYGDDNPLTEMCKKVEEELNEFKTLPNPGKRVREVIIKYNLWIWSAGNIEDLLFGNQEMQNALLENKLFTEFMKDLSVSRPHDPHLSDQTRLPDVKTTKDTCSSLKKEMDKQFEQLNEKFDALIGQPTTSSDPPNLAYFTNFTKKKPLNSIAGRVTQTLDKYVKSVKKSGGKEQEETYWQSVKNRLHNEGKWKNISFELLNQIIKIAIQQQDHELHLLWEHMKNTLITSDRKARIPPKLYQDRIFSMLKKSLDVEGPK